MRDFSVAILAQASVSLLRLRVRALIAFSTSMAASPSSALRPRAPFTIRHGSILVHVNDSAHLPAALAAINPAASARNECLFEKTARHALLCVSDALGMHFPSLGAALPHIRRKRCLSTNLYKRLVQLNITASLLRHSTEAWHKQISSELDASLLATSCPKCSIISEHASSVSSENHVAPMESFDITLDGHLTPVIARASSLPCSPRRTTTPVSPCDPPAEQVPLAEDNCITNSTPVLPQPQVDTNIDKHITLECKSENSQYHDMVASRKKELEEYIRGQQATRGLKEMQITRLGKLQALKDKARGYSKSKKKSLLADLATTETEILQITKDLDLQLEKAEANISKAASNLKEFIKNAPS